ncbi:hypothetical protein ACFYOD_25435 [Streptomyces sp. NPDC006703]|uniref:hypothetical protein n=1 Tax=Streptomyces sp. NPDC006703 TaxID=3364759 RepID=UPI00368251C3
MTPHDELRLLPWSSPDGKPCYLSTDDPAGRLSRLADEMEAAQLDLARELMKHALEMLADDKIKRSEIRHLSKILTEALGDTLRVAALRGLRLATLVPAPWKHSDLPQSPPGADAHGRP